MSNERRIKSLALRAIGKQFSKLKKLKHLNITFAFACYDFSQKRQVIKRDGKGIYYDRLMDGKPIARKEDLSRARIGGTLKESYFPEEEIRTEFITPTNLPCGPGYVKNIAEKQLESLKELPIHNSSENDSFSLGMVMLIYFKVLFYVWQT